MKGEIPMLFDSANVHRLFGVSFGRSNNFKRRISCFRTAEGVSISLFVYREEEKPFIAINVTRGNNDFSLDESYHLYPDGSCNTRVFAQIRSTTGWAVHSLLDDETYKSEQVLAKQLYKNCEWLRKQLDTLADWLMDEKTVRIDPYNPHRILGDDEDEVDRLLAANIAMIEDFKQRLRDIPLTPGIHVIE